MIGIEFCNDRYSTSTISCKYESERYESVLKSDKQAQKTIYETNHDSFKPKVLGFPYKLYCVTPSAKIYLLIYSLAKVH
jgi:hypothetical protein